MFHTALVVMALINRVLTENAKRLLKFLETKTSIFDTCPVPSEFGRRQRAVLSGAKGGPHIKQLLTRLSKRGWRDEYLMYVRNVVILLQKQIMIFQNA